MCICVLKMSCLQYKLTAVTAEEQHMVIIQQKEGTVRKQTKKNNNTQNMFVSLML